MVDTAPCVWVIIEEPPSFTNPGGNDLAAWMPLRQVINLKGQLRARTGSAGTEGIPIECEHDQTITVSCKGDAVTLTIKGSTGTGTVILTDDGIGLLVDRLAWLNEHHYHLSQP